MEKPSLPFRFSAWAYIKTAETGFCFTIIEKVFIHASPQEIIGLASINLVVLITYEKTDKKVAQDLLGARTSRPQ